MLDLRWSWLCVPFALCAMALGAVSLVAALIRGDRVMRLGVIGAAISALPWALCATLSSCTDDAKAAERLLRLGLGPVALSGPNLLLLLLGLSGQLERYRSLFRIALVLGTLQIGLCWGTAWTVTGVHRLTSGILYLTGGVFTDLHIAQVGVWFGIGMLIARRSLMRGERLRLAWVVGLAAVNLTIGGTDMLLTHGVINFFPVAWLPTIVACLLGLYLEFTTDLLRPRGLDIEVLFELAGTVVATALIGGLSYALSGSAPVAIAVLASALWALVIAIMWWIERRRPPRPVFGERAIGRFAARLTEIDDERRVADWITALWRRIDVVVRALWRAEDSQLIDVTTGAAYEIDREIAAWLVEFGEPVAAADLATTQIGALRPRIEDWVARRGATLFVPLVDRDALVGLIEADHAAALRESERGLVAQSARVAARALSYVDLTRRAAREGATAREVEVAEAMRRQASARHDDELGPWHVAAEYRTGARTTGAAWCANLAGDGRLAILVTEGQAHGVAAALATAALTGAFVAATTSASPGIAQLIAVLRASAEDVLHRGESIAAFLAIADAGTGTLAWGCAGHPGALLVTPGDGSADAAAVAVAGGGDRLGVPGGELARGELAFAPDQLLVVASSALHGKAWAWLGAVRQPGGPGARLAARVVDAAIADGSPGEDLLAVVVRQRARSR